MPTFFEGWHHTQYHTQRIFGGITSKNNLKEFPYSLGNKFLQEKLPAVCNHWSAAHSTSCSIPFAQGRFSHETTWARIRRWAFPPRLEIRYWLKGSKMLFWIHCKGAGLPWPAILSWMEFWEHGPQQESLAQNHHPVEAPWLTHRKVQSKN